MLTIAEAVRIAQEWLNAMLREQGHTYKSRVLCPAGIREDGTCIVESEVPAMKVIVRPGGVVSQL